MSDTRPCRYCGRMILWAKHETSGKPMPFDVEPFANQGTGFSMFRRGGEVMCRYVRNGVVPLRRPHFETCEQYQAEKRETAPPSKAAVMAQRELYAPVEGDR